MVMSCYGLGTSGSLFIGHAVFGNFTTLSSNEHTQISIRCTCLGFLVNATTNRISYICSHNVQGTKENIKQGRRTKDRQLMGNPFTFF
jgi:hypothetical protein